jgi:hypothetical protein
MEVATLASRAQELTAALAGFASLKSVAQSLEALQKRQQMLRREQDRLRPAVALLTAARARDVNVQFVTDGDLAKVLDVLSTLATAFSANPKIVVGDEFGATLQAVKKVVASVEAHARAVWTAQAAPVRDEVRGELLEALGRIPAWKGVVVRIQGLQAEIARLAGLPLVSVEQFDQFFRLAEERDSVWQGLRGDGGIPASVVEFLRACTREGVPLDALSPEVTAWLRERNILQHFRVRL